MIQFIFILIGIVAVSIGVYSQLQWKKDFNEFYFEYNPINSILFFVIAGIAFLVGLLL